MIKPLKGAPKVDVFYLQRAYIYDREAQQSIDEAERQKDYGKAEKCRKEAEGYRKKAEEDHREVVIRLYYKKVSEKNIPRFLYKYCEVNPYTLSNLVNSQCYASSREDLNDPNDMPVHRIQEDSLFYSFFQRYRPRVVSLSGYSSEKSSAPDHPLMYSHYADRQRGICIA